MKQVHEHSRQIDPVIVKGAGAPHATQEEYQQKVEEAEYELLEEDAEQTHASEEELRVRIGGRPPAERED